MQFSQCLKKIVSTKESMGKIMKASSFALTEAKYVAVKNSKHTVLANGQNAPLKVRSKQENIAGTKNNLTGLARGGQQVQFCRAASTKAIEESGSVSGNGDNSKLKLYSRWASSSSFRVRIALNLKGLEYEYIAVNLLKGEQFSPEFLKLNPMGYVPVLVDGDVIVSDSFAIIMYLEEKYPQHPLLPRDLQRKAINYQAANIVCSSIQPFQNLATLKYIEEKFSPDEKLPWAKHHIEKGYVALEKLLKDYAGRYATGDEIFLADAFLAPQILKWLNEAYNEIPAFQDAMPEKQPDAPPL